MTTPVLLPTEFDVPLLNPSAAGLYGVTSWTEETGPPRWLTDGVRIKPWNYPGELSSGLWTDPWCPDDLSSGEEPGLKTGERPDILDSFDPLTVWAYDSTQCGDLSEQSRNEARLRAQQVLRLEEQTVVEREFAARLLLDAGAPTVKTDLIGAVGELELAFAATNTVGYIHASAKWAAVAARFNLLNRSGAGMRTPLGHRWVFGYATGLGETLVASSQPFGWRDSVQLRESVEPQTNTFVAIAERSVVIGLEHVLGAVTVTP